MLEESHVAWPPPGGQPVTAGIQSSRNRLWVPAWLISQKLAQNIANQSRYSVTMTICMLAAAGAAAGLEDCVSRLQ